MVKWRNSGIIKANKLEVRIPFKVVHDVLKYAVLNKVQLIFLIEFSYFGMIVEM